MLWLDKGSGAVAALTELYAVSPLLILCAVLALLIRCARWHWLLARAGCSYPSMKGWLAYFSGFAFTASPGKVGKLARIRYFEPLGVSPPLVISAFVYERALDVVVVLAIALLAAWRWSIFPLAAGFAVLLVATVVWACRHPRQLDRIGNVLRRAGWLRLDRFFTFLKQGLAHTVTWTGPLDLTIALSLGILAWGLTAVAFKLLLDSMGVNLPVAISLSLYPTAMLAGAASMLPGGVGSTEVVLVSLLTGFDVPVATATVAAIGIRLSTLWLATLIGIGAMLALARTDLKRRVVE